MITLEEAKAWLKIDYDDEDADIQVLIDGAIAYLKNATGNTYDNTNALARIYGRVLIMEWFENREMMQANKTNDKVRFTLQSIMMQLQYSTVGIIS